MKVPISSRSFTFRTIALLSTFKLFQQFTPVTSSHIREEGIQVQDLSSDPIRLDQSEAIETVIRW